MKYPSLPTLHGRAGTIPSLTDDGMSAAQAFAASLRAFSPTVLLIADLGTNQTAGGLPAIIGQSVGEWKDQSGSDNDAIQATAANRPVVATGLNGHLSLSFDGTDDLMATESDITDNTLVVAVTSSITVVSNPRVWGIASSQSVGPFASAGTDFGYFSAGGVHGIGGDPSVASVITVENTSTGARARVNGVNASTFNRDSNNLPDPLTIASQHPTGGENLLCKMSFIGVFPNTASISAIEATVASYYGITV